MINPKTKLTILHDNNGVFSDHSDNASDYLRDTFDLDLSSTEDYLYIGFYKPFNSFYIELSTPNVNENTMAAEYWDGSSWVSLTLNDETKGLTRSGYMFFDKESMQSTSVNSIEKYYIRFRPDADHSVTSVSGINSVFADDQMLKQEVSEITNAALLPAGGSSHISKHVAARNYIIQSLRNDGYIKQDSDRKYENITQFDLMDIFEIRQAATYLALSKIYLELSDDPEDTHWSKYQKYQDMFEKAFSLARLTFDANDDGITDKDEKAERRRVIRWSR